MSAKIRVAAVVLQRADGAILLVRKRDTAVFMNPGGKPEPDETPIQCAIREVREELGLELLPANLDWLGDLAAPAANEADHIVQAWVFRHTAPVPDVIHPAAEIEEIAWAQPTALPPLLLAPLFTQQILPALAARNSS